MKSSSKDNLIEITQPTKANVNPYIQVLIDAQKDKSLPLLYGPELRKRFNKWSKHFQAKNLCLDSPREIILEIGSHKGKVLCELAQDQKHKNFIGLDITYKRVALTARKIHEQNLNNATVLLANARYLDQFIAKDEINGIILFFPDPWVKKSRQKHNRLINKEFCSIIKQILKKDGFIWLKTDSIEYFEEAKYYLEEESFRCFSESVLPFNKNYISTFEQNFHRKDIHTYSSCWYNTKDSISHGDSSP